MTKVLSRQDNK